MSMWNIVFFVVALCTYNALGNEPEVEIEDIFGKVLFQQGHPQKITCLVYDPVPGGELTWVIDDKVLDDSKSNEIKDEGDQLEQVLNFVPQLEHDNKSLACQYKTTPGGDSSSVYSDHIQVGIYMLEVPNDLVSVPPATDGSKVRLELTARLYPEPKPGDITWVISRPTGDIVAELVPGGQDTYGLYSAGEIQVVSQYMYRFYMDISVLDRDEVSNSHSIVITNSGIKKSVNFVLALQLSEDEKDLNDTSEGVSIVEEKNKETKSEVTETQSLGMGTGLFIIVGIIIIFIICCVAYCIYRKRKKNQDSKKSMDRKTYIAVNTKSEGDSI